MSKSQVQKELAYLSIDFLKEGRGKEGGDRLKLILPCLIRLLVINSALIFRENYL